MRRPRSATTIIALLASSALLPAAPLAAADAPKPLFAASDVVHLTIRGPINELTATNGKSRKPVDGTVTVEGSVPETLPIALSTRGITRGDREICPFPPLRVDFTQKPAPGSLFAGQKSLKLVTHCQQDAGFQRYELLEYAVYKMYQQLTPTSFGVRLASIDYVGRSGQKVVSRSAFFIEDAGDVAKRAGLTHLKVKNRVPVAALSARDAARFAVFQYMVGNLDWAMTAGPAGSNCCHNARLIAATAATTGLVPVPYDFDFAGVVDAPYATPPEGIKLPSVRIRRYRGYCVHNDAARAAAGELLAQRATLVGALDGVGLSSSVQHKATSYLGEFFDQVSTPKGVDSMLKTCLS